MAKNPDLSFMALLDHHREALVVDKIDDGECSNEWDGCVWFVTPESEKALVDAKKAAAAPFEFAVKPLEDQALAMSIDIV